MTVTSMLKGIAAALALFCCASGTRAQSGHAFACTDYSQGKVFLVDRDGKVTWTYDAPSCNDLQVLPDGNLLFNTGHGVKEVTREKKVVFQYDSKSEIYACQRLTNGLTFVGECNSGRLLELKPDGTVVKEVRLLPAGKDGGHSYIRNARRLDNGNYLVAHYGEQIVREYDPTGGVVRVIDAKGGPHSIERLTNGNTLISVGDRPGGGRIFEVDPAGKVVWEVTNADLNNIGLTFLAGFQRLPNGNTIIANWLGHGKFGTSPHLIEVTRNKKIVWTFADHKTMKTISFVRVLDEASKTAP